MIRFSRFALVLGLVLQFGTVLTACSSQTAQETSGDDMSAIDDDGGGDAGAVAGDDVGIAPDLGAPADAGPEGGVADDGASNGGTSDTAAVAPESGSPAAGEDDLENEFAQGGDDLDAPPPAADVADGELTDEPGGEPTDVAATETGETDNLDPLDTPTEEAGTTTVDPAPVAEGAPTPDLEAPEKARVRDIRYLANSNGGTVVIETTKPVTYQTRLNKDSHQYVVELAEADLPATLQRPLLTKDFNSRIASVNAYQGEGSTTARIVVQLNGNDTAEPVIQQEGNSLVVIPPAPSATAGPALADQKRGEGKSAEAKQEALGARTLDEFLTGNQKFMGRPISLQVKDADVRDVVNFLAEESGANIVMSEDVKGTISLKLRKVPWDQALVMLMRSRELGYVRQGNVLRISTLKSLQSETEQANKIIEAQKAIVPAVVQVIPISYASLDDMVKNLTPFLSKEGKVVADNRTQTLIVTDKGEVVERVQKLVKTLDIPPAQVSIESKIVEALEDFSNFAGVTWSASGANVQLSPSGGNQGTPLNFNGNAISKGITQNLLGTGPLTAGFTLGTLDVFGDLSATLSLAERDSIAKVISSPRISSMNREKSTIIQKGENIAILTTRSETTGSVTKSPSTKSFSLQLDVTPQITTDGGVIMDLDVKREFLGPVIDIETNARPINARQAKTKVLVRNGQTAVIGGIYTSDDLEARDGIPGLMNIPILGWLFKNRTITRSKSELLIFLTPRILAVEDLKTQTAAAPAPPPADAPGEDESLLE